MRIAQESVQMLEAFDRSLRVLMRTERSEPEIAFPARTEARSRCADDMPLLEKIIKELPAGHAIRRLQPDIRSAVELGAVAARPQVAHADTGCVLQFLRNNGVAETDACEAGVLGK